MNTDPRFREDEVAGQYHFDSGKYTVNTVSTGVTENARIDSDWIDNTSSALRAIEDAQNSREDVMRPVEFSLYDRTKSKSFRLKSLVGFLVFMAVVGVVAVGVFVGLENENEQNNDDNELKINQEFNSVDQETLDFICTTIFSTESPEANFANFGVCLDEENLFLCKDNAQIFIESCGNNNDGEKLTCECDFGSLIDLRTTANDNDICIALTRDEESTCPILELDVIIGK